MVTIGSYYIVLTKTEIRTPLNGLMSVLTLVASTNLDEDQRSLIRMGKGASYGVVTNLET